MAHNCGRCRQSDVSGSNSLNMLVIINIILPLLVASGGAVESNGNRVKIAVPVEMQLPLPTRAGGSAGILKAEVVHRSGNRSKIVWHGLKSSPAATEDLVSHVTLLDIATPNGKISAEDAILKFSADSGIDRSKLVRNVHLKAPGEVIAVSDFEFGKVIEINTTLAGWRPGNTTVLIVSADQTKAIKIDPAWHLKFDWSKAAMKW